MANLSPSLICLLLLLALTGIEGVDRSKFKTCSQSSFCRRNRSIKDGTSSHTVLKDSIKNLGLTITADVTNPYKEDAPLILEIKGMKQNTFRFKINEKSPIRPRFEVQDSLNFGDDYFVAPISFEVHNDHFLVQYENNTKVLVYYSPIKMEVIKNDKILMIVNERKLFNFEHYRSSKDEVVQNALSLSESELSEHWRDAWEESFGGHQDRKPYGPSSVGLDITFVGTKHIYGIPEHASDLNLKPTSGEGINSDPYRLYNLDVFEYELDNPMALYGSVPFLMSHSKEYSSGLLWLNAAETWIDIKKTEENGLNKVSSHWISESGIIDAFVFIGEHPHDIFKSYSALSGSTPLPPLFSIAYHQCRWNYKDEEDVASVDENFDKNDIPYDVIWLDIEHTDNKKYFTWDQNHFPTPTKMQENIASKQRKMVTIIDPHIKRESSYPIHSEATSLGYYVKNYENNDYEGWCWPGSSSWLDFVNPVVRQYWAQKFDYNTYQSSTPILYTWNDMNEPSVFNGPEVTMHKDCKHISNWEHRDLHNMYGFYMHKATFEGLLQRNKDQNERPFLLTRSFFVGSQKYGAVWTGDNAGQWSHLNIAQPMLLSLSVAGINFVGADVGGFFGNPDGELMVRWYQAAAFHPFFRGHAHLDTKRREPWLFGEPYTGLIRSAIQIRYSLLPFWYTTFYQSSITGIPIIRPLWVEFPQDINTFDIQDQFLVSDSFLVKPVVNPGQQNTEVYLPGTSEDLWYEYDGTQKYNGGATIKVDTPLHYLPLYQRGGSIIPSKQRNRRSSSIMINDPFTLQIALDSKQGARGVLYIDDGHTYNYERQNAYMVINMEFKGNKLTSIAKKGNNDFKIDNKVERIIISGYTNNVKSVSVELKSKQTELEFSIENSKLVIRNPELNISEDFTIKLN